MQGIILQSRETCSMEKKHKMDFNWDLFDKVPVVGMLRGVSLEDVVQILPICVTAGLRNIEITMNSMDVQKSIQYAERNYGSELNIGAGTVCCMEDLERALSFGASFIVMPNLNEEVVETCVRLGVPVFPGAYSPSEIYRAWELGASMVKVFPIDTLGPKFLRNIRAPFDTIKLLPTGGIDATNVQDYFLSGADGVGVSSGLFNKEMVKKKDWAALEEHIKTFVSVVEQTHDN